MIELPPRHNPNYLAKDFNSFRTLLLDHLVALAPGAATDAASLEATLVEVLAYVGDYLSYYQDAVATEAYLMTARQRSSVRRHARLLDRNLSEGCSARVWVHLEAAADDVPVPQGTALLTKIRHIDAIRVPADYETEGREVFETMHDTVLMRAHNYMALFDPQAPPQPGQTEARLADSLPRLAPGDVLIFQHSTRHLAHALRLTSVSAEAQSTVIAWHDEDAFPAGFPAGGSWTILGNIVLADHGRSLAQPLPAVWRQGLSELSLALPELTYAMPYRHQQAVRRSAAEAMRQDPRAAEPAMTLRETADFLSAAAMACRSVWMGGRETLHATQFERRFAVEPSGGGEVTLRFGDGVHGRRLQPDWDYVVHSRTGLGTRGNIGPNTLAHIVIDDDRILGISNPLPGSCGADAETLDQARLEAPFAADTQRRCVTAADYIAMTNLFPGVRGSFASRSRIRARSVVSIRVRRLWDRPWDQEFEERLRAYLKSFQLIGDVVELSGADYVAPAVAIELAVESGWSSAAVIAAVRARLLGTLTFDFGEPLDPAILVACAEAVPGVTAARIVRPVQEGPTVSALASVEVAAGEIIRLDSARLAITARAER